MINLEKFRERRIKNKRKKGRFYLIEISVEIGKFVYFFQVTIRIN